MKIKYYTIDDEYYGKGIEVRNWYWSDTGFRRWKLSDCKNYFTVQGEDEDSGWKNGDKKVVICYGHGNFDVLNYPVDAISVREEDE